jgi:ribonuclease Z
MAGTRELCQPRDDCLHAKRYERRTHPAVGGMEQYAAMARVTVLGSGSPVPEPKRAGSAVAVVGDRDWVLVDCGRAVTQRAIDAGLDLTSVVALAVTHHHSDHISDLATFATTRWTAGAGTALTVLAPSGPTALFVEGCLDAFDDQSFYGQAPESAGPRPTINTLPFDGSRHVDVVYSSAGWTVSSVLVDHHPIERAVGYLVEHRGRRVAISGDTAVCDAMDELTQGVDVLVHQALLPGRVSAGLLDWNASARAVGELAARTAPRTLVLTHLIPAPNSPSEERKYVDEVRAGGFAGRVLVANDLLEIEIET